MYGQYLLFRDDRLFDEWTRIFPQHHSIIGDVYRFIDILHPSVCAAEHRIIVPVFCKGVVALFFLMVTIQVGDIGILPGIEHSFPCSLEALLGGILP